MEKEESNKRKLESLKKPRPFAAPEGYFDAFPGRIREIIEEKDSTGRTELSFIRLLRPQLALAAGFTGLVLLGYFAFRLILGPAADTHESTTGLAEYIEYHIDDFEESQILDITEGELYETEPGEYLEEEIIQYLLNENIDESTILEELQ